MKEEDFYTRQIILNDVGKEGQQRLKESSVLIIGAGGLGCPASLYLAAAGLGHIGIVDFDRVDVSNLHRQILFSPDEQDQPKAPLLAKKLTKQNPFIRVQSHTEYLSASSIDSIAAPYSTLLDCSDNFATRFLVHDYAFRRKKNLIQAALYQWEGQLLLFPFAQSNTEGCLRCLWAEEPQETCVKNCSEAGIIGSVAGVLGTLQANATLRLLLQKPGLPALENFMINLDNFTTQRLQIKRNPSCPLCSHSPALKTFPCDANNMDYHDIPQGSHQGEPWCYVDIREPNEYREEESLVLPQDTLRFPSTSSSFPSCLPPPQVPVLLICQGGVRSKKLCQLLRESGRKKTYNLLGGVSLLLAKSTLLKEKNNREDQHKKS